MGSFFCLSTGIFTSKGKIKGVNIPYWCPELGNWDKMCDTSLEFGLKFTFTTTGKVQVGVSGSFQDPSFNADSSFAVDISRPTPETITAGSAFSLGLDASQTASKLTTAFTAPSFSSTFALENTTTVAGKVCLGTCANASGTLLNFDEDISLLGFNDISSDNAALTAFGAINIPFINFNTEVDVCQPAPGIKNCGTVSGVLFVKINTPDYEETATAVDAVTVSQTQQIIELKPDLAGIPKTYFQVPVPLSSSVNIGGVRVEYTTFEGKFGPAIGYNQTSIFDPGNLRTGFTFDQPVGRWLNPQKSGYEIVNSLSLNPGEMMPELFFLYSDQNVTVTPTYSLLNSTFRNTTAVTYDFVWKFNALGINVNLPLRNISEGIVPNINEDYGPLLAFNGSRTMDNTPIANTNFGVSFASLTGNPFSLQAATSPCATADQIASGFIFDRFCSGTLVKYSDGVAELFNHNSHAGGTILQGGILKIDRDINLGHDNGLLEFDGGTLLTRNFDESLVGIVSHRPVAFTSQGGTFDTNGLDSTLSGSITGLGTFTKKGFGALTLSGANSSSGATIVAGGTLRLAAEGTLNGITALTVENPGVFDISSASSDQLHIGSLAGQGTVQLVNNTLVTGANNSNSSFHGLINGNGGLSKAGTGTMTLTGTNTYSGTTTFHQDLISISGDTILGNGGPLLFAGGGLRTTASFATGRSMTLDDNGGIFTTDTDTSLTINSAINGNGGLTKQDTGNLVLTNSNNSYLGDTFIEAGALIMKDNGKLHTNGAIRMQSDSFFDISGVNHAATTIGLLDGDGSVLLGDRTLITGNALSSAFNGNISGNGAQLEKHGSGTFILTGTNTYSGSTLVSGGSLLVHGFLGSSAVTVQGGALLGGNGIVPDSLVQSNGILSPGNSIGTLTINGDLTMAAGSNLLAEVESYGPADLVQVTGNALLNGGTVVAEAGGQLRYRPINFYTILTAHNGINGIFDQTVTNLAYLNPSLAYDPHNVFLTLRRNDVDFRNFGTTGNQSSVAQALNRLVPTAAGALADVINTVYDLSPAEGRAALGSMTGGHYQNMLQATFNNTQMFLQADMARLASLFGNSVPVMPSAGLMASSMRFAKTMDPTVLSDAVPAPGLSMAPERDDTVSGKKAFGFWLRGLVGKSNFSGDSTNPGFTTITDGVMTGFDTMLGNKLVLGISAARMRPKAKMDNVFDHSSWQDKQYGIYSRFISDAWRMDAVLNTGRQKYDTTRLVTDGINSSLTSSSFKGSSHSGKLGFGYSFTLDPEITIEPLLGLQYSRMKMNSHQEHGAGVLDLIVPAHKETSLRSTIGSRLGKTFTDKDGTTFVLEGQVEWAHEFHTALEAMPMHFAGDTINGAFAILPAGQSANSVLLSTRLTGSQDTTSLFIDLGAEVSSSQNSWLGSIGLIHRW